MALITTGTFPQLLLADINMNWASWNTYDLLLDDIYERRDMGDMPFATIQELPTLDAAFQHFQGAQPLSQTMTNDGQQTTYTPQIWMASFTMTREAIDWQRYKGDWPQFNKNLRLSIEERMNIYAMMPINNGFDPNYKYSDGEPLFSTEHKIQGGLQANTFSNFVGFNLKSLKDLITISRMARSLSGNQIVLNSERLLYHPNIEFDVREVLGSPDRPDTANRSINSVWEGSYLPKGAVFNPYLSIPTFFGFTTNNNPTFLWYDKDPIEIVWESDLVGNMTFLARNSYVAGPPTWRVMYASA